MPDFLILSHWYDRLREILVAHHSIVALQDEEENVVPTKKINVIRSAIRNARQSAVNSWKSHDSIPSSFSCHIEQQHYF